MILYQKTLSCGCTVRNYGTDKLTIKYCPKHAAVDDLLEALKIVLDKLNLAIDSDDWGLVSSALYITESAICLTTARD